ncbi:MAG: YidC/Oxa1 family membrane protein insertase [Candidatus Buchananbacteria bacterium]
MMHILTIIFYQPLLNLLVFIYNVIPAHDMGLAIIVITIIIKLALYPFGAKSIKAQKAMTDLQPKINELKKQYPDKQEQAKELMKLYKEEKISPFSSCLPLLIQLPFLIAIYEVFRTGLTNGSLSLLYPFVSNPGTINSMAFGFLDLSKPDWILAVLAGAAQFWQARMFITKKPEVKSDGSKDENMAAMVNKQMLYMMPIVTIIIGISLPSGLVLYWLVVTIITALQQIWTLRKKKTSTEIILK